MMTDEIFQINLQEIIRSKAPKVYKKIPKAAITALAKLVKQKELNEILRRNASLSGVEFMQNAVKDFGVTLQLRGVENLPSLDHRCIFASNHPLGGLDGICLSAVLGEKYDGHIRYLVNDILYFLEPLRDIFVPINKHGAQAKEAVSLLNAAFSSDNQIITFPAGLCSRKNHSEIRDLQWKKMFISKAIEYQRDIVPVYFNAKNSNFFYRLANFRKQIGLKFNIEMLLLPREMFKAKNSTFTITFGKPIAWQTFDTSKTPQQWADELQEKNYGGNYCKN
jgi:putative hemolysin